MSEKLNEENIVNVTNESIDESVSLFAHDLSDFGFKNIIVKNLGDRFLIVKNEFAKSYDFSKLNKNNRKQFSNQIFDVCKENNIDIQ